jgi:hypothetical protein
MASPNTQGCPECQTNLLWLVFGCKFTGAKLVPLPSLIPGLPIRPFTPFVELEAGSVPPSFNFPQLDFVKPSSGFHPVTWERVIIVGHQPLDRLVVRIQSEIGAIKIRLEMYNDPYNSKALPLV